jgi:hypothetical protein
VVSAEVRLLRILFMNFLIYFLFQVWSYRGLSESDLRHLLSSLGKFLLMAIQFDSLGSASSFPVKLLVRFARIGFVELALT